MAGQLNFVQTGDNSQLLASLLQSKKAFNSLNDTANATGVTIDDMFSKAKSLGSLVGVTFGTAGIVSFAKKIYNARSAMQDLESTMKVFLGSEEKASKFTKELQDYAYWNMFEFTDLTEASTQLMAYGNATEDLIPIIDKLSNVATGTKKPLEQYINLYNKAKSTGKVDAVGLQQWAAAGIVLKDELKALDEAVDGNTITFEQLDKVLNHVTSDGERFGGLMMSQMDNLSASFGQLEDNFAAMLNELGEKLQDTFKGGIDYAGILIDNYEKIGKVLFALVAMYGEYKAVLIATAAIQKAGMFMKSVRAMMEMRTQLGLLRAAQQAFNITAMQNPYIAIAAGIVMATTAIIGIVSALKDERTETEKLNDSYDERTRTLEDDQRKALEQIRTLKDETASTEALTAARKELAKNPLFEGEDITGMSAQQLLDLLNKKVAEQQQEAEKELASGRESQRLEKTKSLISASRTYYSASNSNDGQMRFGVAPEAMNRMKALADEIKGIDTEEINDIINGVADSKKPLEEQNKALEENKKKLEAEASQARVNLALIEQKKDKTEADNEAIALNNLVLQRAANAVELYDKAIKNNNDTIDANNKKMNEGIDMPTLIANIGKYERKLSDAQKAFASKQSEANKKKLEEAETNLKGATETYQAATGKQWVDSTKMAEEYIANLRKLMNEEIKIKNSAIKDERVARKAAFDQQIKELNEEEAEYKRTHNGRGSGTLTRKIENVKLQYQLDIESLDRQLADWLRAKNRETRELEYDFGIKQLERAIKLENDWNAKLEMQDDLRSAIVQHIKEEAEEVRKAELGAFIDPDKYAAFEEYSSATDDNGRKAVISRYVEQMADKGITVSQEDVLASFAEMSKKAVAISKQTQEKIRQQNTEFANEDIDLLLSMASSYAGYVEKKEDLDRDYNYNKLLIEKIDDEALKSRLTEANEKMYREGTAELGEILANDSLDPAKPLAKRLAQGITSGYRDAIALLKKLSKKEEITDIEKSFLVQYLGLTDEGVQFMQEHAEAATEFLEKLDGILDTKEEYLGGSFVESIGNMFKNLSDKMKDAEDKGKAFKDYWHNLFTGENIGQFVGMLGQGIDQINAALQEFAGTTDDPAVQEAADIFGGMLQNVSSAAQGAASGGWIGAIIGGVTDALGQLTAAVQSDMHIMESYTSAMNSYSQGLKKMRYAEMLSDDGSTIFGGVERGKLVAALNTIRKVKDDYSEMMQQFQSDTFIASQGLDELFDILDKRANYTSTLIAELVLTGSPTGIGGMIGGIVEANKALKEFEGTTFETLVGGFNTWNQDNIDQFVEKVKSGYSAIEALQVKTKDYKLKKDEYTSLKDLAPEMFNADGSINPQIAQHVLESYGEGLTNAQKLLLGELIDNQNAYNEALEQAMSYYESLFGSLGDSLMNSFVNSFQTGEDAMDDFTKSLEDSIEKWIVDLAKMAYVQPVLETMNNMVKDAVKGGKDTDAAVDTAIEYLLENVGRMQDGVNSALDRAQQKYSELYGMELFNPDENPKADSGGFKSMSQDTADELNARFTALQMEGASVVSATSAMQESMLLMQSNSDRQVLLIQDIDRFQQIAYDQAQERMDILRAVQDSVSTIQKHTARLSVIERNTDRL